MASTTLAGRLAALRRRHKMTHLEAARAAGLRRHQASIQWEQGRCIPRLPQLIRLARHYGIDVGDLCMLAGTRERKGAATG